MHTATSTETVAKTEAKPKPRHSLMFVFILFMLVWVTAFAMILGELGGSRGAPAVIILAAICGVAMLRQGRALSGAARAVTVAIGALFMVFVIAAPVAAIVAEYQGREAARAALERLEPHAGELATLDNRAVYEFQIRDGDRSCTGRALVRSSLYEAPDVTILSCTP